MPDLPTPLQAHGAGVSSDRRAAFTVPGLDMDAADEVIELLDDALVTDLYEEAAADTTVRANGSNDGLHAFRNSR